MQKSNNKKRVLVAMSGGVDSSVAAFLLKQKGYEVIGVTMCFGLPDAKGKRPSCCSVSGIEDARRVAEQLDINHYVFSFGLQLKEKVISDFLKEYLRGRTPNPCIRCNQYLKFDELIKRAREMNCDYLATGHYARIVQNKNKQRRSSQIRKIQMIADKKTNGQFFLKVAKDAKKDQSYFLYRLPKDKMDFVLFPLANYTKDEVRKIARENKLRVADKPGSQDVCFIPDRDYEQFFKQRVDEKSIKPGPIKDLKGNILGKHKGIVFYTVGQRKGLGIAYRCPLYVVSINSKTNTLIVGEKEDVYKSKLIATDLYLLFLKSLPKRLEVKAKIRYNHPKAKAIIRPLKNNKVSVEFLKPQWAITPGQAIVFYENEVVIGGATIEGSL
jgi:tRNA-specific 2-thiouridylase